MRYVISLIDYSNSLIGAESTANLIALGSLMGFIAVYSTYYIIREAYRAKEVARLAIPEAPKRILCPGCPTDFTVRLEGRRGTNLIYKAYKNYEITCEDCLAVSQWETSGYPICLEWRIATSKEIEQHAKNQAFIRRLDEIDAFKKNLVAYEEYKRLNGRGSSLLARRQKPF